ncbi:MAG: DUF4976 domain-containing protein [Caldilineaceae bacterium]
MATVWATMATAKSGPCTTSSRMPLIVWTPSGSQTHFAGGRQLDGLCQLMDIGPAILELAGVAVPAAMAAESLLPALQDPAVDAWQGRDYVFAEHGKDGILQETEFMTMVRSREWKLVHFLDEPFGQLFHLADDPDEVHNLWDEPTHEAQRRELLDVLREWRIRSAWHTQAWSKAWR